MNKGELVGAIAKGTGLSKAASESALDNTIDAIKKSLKKGESVSLVGFGTFKVSKRSARTGRNPQTGATIKIPARKVPRFSAGKGLKDIVK
ncbi:MAG TPA: HU family DNA-binding protein [Candidatus Kapabacteria bacterium]|nr:HU family DNA-binding protein [Candidatus Kapabacteria bacterium]